MDHFSGLTGYVLTLIVMPRPTKNSQKTETDMETTLKTAEGGEQEPLWLSKLNEKLDCISKIEKQVSEIHTGMSTVNDGIEELTKSLQTVTLKNESLEVKLTEVECENIKLRSELSDMKTRMLYLESQSRRDNLVFDGLEEDENETWEKTEEKIRKLFATNFEIENANVLMLERVHRIGKKTAVKPRQIIVKFSHYKDRQRIWLTKNKLKDSSVKMFEDYPAEIRQNRQTLWPYFQAARNMSAFKSVSLNQDKLFLNNKMYTVKNVHDVPDCLKPENRSVRSSNDTVVFYSKHAVFSNFHSMPVTVEGQKYLCNEQYFQRAKAQMFNDNASADKIMLETDPVKMSNLGKTVKGFNEYVWAKQAPLVLHRVNNCKYEQNKSAKDALIKTGSRVIGEASPNKTYGTGVHINAKNALDQSSWGGDNMMGKILMRIRESLAPQDQEDPEFLDTSEFIQND